jgi:hypothetical protein
MASCTSIDMMFEPVIKVKEVRDKQRRVTVDATE